jgi:hypothetical protein
MSGVKERDLNFRFPLPLPPPPFPKLGSFAYFLISPNFFNIFTEESTANFTLFHRDIVTNHLKLNFKIFFFLMKYFMSTSVVFERGTVYSRNSSSCTALIMKPHISLSTLDSRPLPPPPRSTRLCIYTYC